MWLFIQSEKHYWTVGFYNPKGEWVAQFGYSEEGTAAAQCHYLNGGEREA